MTKKRRIIDDPLETPAARLPTYGTGEVAAILGTEIWRVQKYLDSPKYGLSPSGSLGSGRGSRRVFSLQDIYRLGVAEHLVRNGFSYKFVSEALQQIEDEDLLGRIGEEGVELPLVYVLSGGEGSVTVKAVHWNRKISEFVKTTKNAGFYVLDLGGVATAIQSKMQELGLL